MSAGELLVVAGIAFSVALCAFLTAKFCDAQSSDRFPGVFLKGFALFALTLFFVAADGVVFRLLKQ